MKYSNKQIIIESARSGKCIFLFLSNINSYSNQLINSKATPNRFYFDMDNSKKNIIFSINAGRSGSSYLASLMKGFSEVDSYHEPIPRLCEKPMKDYQLGDKNAFNLFLGEKVDKIKNTLNKNMIYFESNHYFIKGFGWEIMSEFEKEKIGIIILKRNPDEIIESFFNNGVSILGNGAVMHLIHPFSMLASKFFFKSQITFNLKLLFMRLIIVPYNIPYFFGLRKRKNFKLFKNFQIEYLKWYIEEYHYLKKKFIQHYPNVSYLEIDINAMNQKEIIKLISDKFGLGAYRPVPLKINSSKERLKKN